MTVQFLLFVIAILLFSIFWVLSKINSNVKTILSAKRNEYERPKLEVPGPREVLKPREG